MQALDEFVTRARSQNGLHHETHVQSLNNLSSIVRQSYSNIGDHFETTSADVRSFADEVSNHSNALRSAIPPLEDDIRKPLAELGSNMQRASMTEYSVTGQTPQKTNYDFSPTLPRTQPHGDLLAKLRHNTSGPNLETLSESLPDDEAEKPISPSKTTVYNDAIATIQEDQDMEEVPPPRFLSTLQRQPPLHSSHTHPLLSPTRKPTSTSGLREVDVNLIQAPGHSSLSSAALAADRPHSADDADGHSIPQPTALKRHATTDALTKLPQKRSRQARAEGRENDPVVEVRPVGRRLRSSPTS